MGIPGKLRALLITAPLILLATAFMGTLSILVSLFDSTGRAQHRVARKWARILLFLGGVGVEVEGAGKIAPGGAYVFAPNHRSFMDIPVVLPHIVPDFRFMANHYLFDWPFIGYHLRRAGHLPVNQGSPRDSLRSMSEAAKVVAGQGVSVLIFPEAGRTHGELKPFKDGAAYIAIKAGVPLVPVGLIGMREVLPIGSVYVKGGRVRMRFGDPIPTAGLSLHDRTALTQRLHETVAELISEPATAGPALSGSKADSGCRASESSAQPSGQP